MTVPSWRENAAAGIPLAVAQARATESQSLTPEPAKGPSRTGQAPSPAIQQVVRPSARDRWMSQAARSYTPERVEQVLRAAITGGDLVAQWELFDLMEDTSPRIKKNLNELKRAVKAYDRKTQAWAEEDEPATPEAEERAKLVSRALWTMRPRADENQNGYDDTIYDILDAWGKGTVVLEVDYEVREAGKFGNITAPKCTRWIHPRYYGYPAQGDWLGLNTQEIASSNRTASHGTTTANSLPAVEGVYARFPDNKFLICNCRSKSGHPAGAALLRSLAFWWAASNFTQEWFLNLAQIFGLPIRWATYDPAIPGLLDKLCDMLADMGSQAWGAFPAGTSFDLKEGPKAGTDNPQVALLDRADQQYDILILGQTLTTTQGDRGSQALGTVHKTVRDEIIEAASEFVASVLNQQLVPAIELLNYGDNRLTPEVCLEAKKVEDGKANAERDAILLKNPDFEIPKKWYYKRHGVPLPNPDDEVITGGSVTQNSLGPLDNAANGKPVNAKGHRANDATDRIVEAALEGLTGVEGRWLGGVKPFFRDLVAKAKDGSVSDGDFVKALERAQREMPELFSKLKGEAVAEALEEAMGAAVVTGAVRGFMKRGGGR
jgi:phage gp29-like protein